MEDSHNVEERYFNWLYSKIVQTQNPTPSLSYLTLARDLHAVEFVWLVVGDDNRAEDGLELRKVFLKMFPENGPWSNLGCSVLEMLIAFSERAEFETSLTSGEWFWMFLENLNISELNDAAVDITPQVQEALEVFVWRTYEPNGFGGLFPLERPECDQREVEIWYQFCAYIDENDIL